VPRRIRGRALERFLAGQRVAVLSTVGEDGAPVSTPIWYEYRGGRFFMRTAADSDKTANVRRDARVTVCVQDERAPYASVTAYGRAEVADADDALGARMARRYLGAIGGAFYMRQARAAVEAGPEVTLVVTPERFATQDFSLETPAVGRLWLKLKRVLPPWL
jgi:PPOX class probable F420-dependent enzyme